MSEFKFDVGDKLKSIRKPVREVLVMRLGTNEKTGDAYQLFIEGSALSGKFYPKDAVEKNFRLVAAE